MATGGKEEVSLCYYYNTPSGCWNEVHCRFRHVREDSYETRPICRFWGTTRSCWYGDHCYFQHVKPSEEIDQSKGMADMKVCSDANNNRTEKDPKLEESDEQELTLEEVSLKISAVKISEDTTGKKGRQRNRKNKKKYKTKINTDKSLVKSDTKAKNVEADAGLENGAAPGEEEDVCGDKTDDSDDDIDHGENNDDGPPGKEEDGAVGGRSIKKDVKCGECGQLFRDGQNGQDLYTAVEQHYMDQLGKADKQHTKIFRENEEFSMNSAFCGACGRIFNRVEDLLRHLGTKSKIKRKDKYFHKEYFWEIAHQFVDRDIGYDDEEELKDNLVLLVSQHCTCSCSDDDDSDNDANSMSSYVSRQLLRMSKLSPGELEEESEERALNFGFTEDEVEELMCQGIKPWDSEAYAALGVLYDCDDYDDF